MAQPLAPDGLWEAIAPLPPRHEARPGKRGRPPEDDRACLAGIAFALRGGTPWGMLPQEAGCGPGVTCWRRPRHWRRRGAREKPPHAPPQRAGREKGIAWGHCRVDGQGLRAVFGGPAGQSPTGRAKKVLDGARASTAKEPRGPRASPGRTATSRSKR